MGILAVSAQLEISVAIFLINNLLISHERGKEGGIVTTSKNITENMPHLALKDLGIFIPAHSRNNGTI